MTDTVLVALIAAIPGSLAAAFGFLNRSKIEQLEVKVDGRLTQLLAVTEKSSHAEGVKQELDREK